MLKLDEIQLDLVPQPGGRHACSGRRQYGQRVLKGIDRMSAIAGANVRPPQRVEAGGVRAVR
jgi:hypothetical protein